MRSEAARQSSRCIVSAPNSPISAPALKGLQHTIEEWAADDSRIIEVLARAGSLSVAYAAYWAALAARPRSRIVLRQRALELAARDPLR